MITSADAGKGLINVRTNPFVILKIPLSKVFLKVQQHDEISHQTSQDLGKPPTRSLSDLGRVRVPHGMATTSHGPGDLLNRMMKEKSVRGTASGYKRRQKLMLFTEDVTIYLEKPTELMGELLESEPSKNAG